MFSSLLVFVEKPFADPYFPLQEGGFVIELREIKGDLKTGIKAMPD